MPLWERAVGHTQIELRSAVGSGLRDGPFAYQGMMLKRRR
jgi:hypothetical protein